LKPTEEAFWDFSIDHLALHDLPDAVSYILKVTGAPSLSYIGFSQGKRNHQRNCVETYYAIRSSLLTSFL
jgi:hypothetical protein